VLDPFAIFKHIAFVWTWWRKRVGTKWLIAGMGVSTIAVAILGCRETYG